MSVLQVIFVGVQKAVDDRKYLKVQFNEKEGRKLRGSARLKCVFECML
jgi:hypothetical protein